MDASRIQGFQEIIVDVSLSLVETDTGKNNFFAFDPVLFSVVVLLFSGGTKKVTY